MPTNLPPEYSKAEERFREATDPLEKIARLEELISTVPKHKGTDKLRADLRKKLSKLKASAESGKRGARRDPVWHIEREGSGTVALIGAANAGKSALLSALSNAAPEVSPAAHSTWQPTPGMMDFGQVQFQLIDTPSFDREYLEPQLLDIIRRADLVAIVVDLHADANDQLNRTLERLSERRIEPVLAPDGRRRTEHAPILVLANKLDTAGDEENLEIFLRLMEGDWQVIGISAETGRGFEELGQEIFNRLEIMRVYSQTPGKPANLDAPYVMKRGGTVEDFARAIHHDFYEKLKSARVWGQGVFDGQQVGRDHVLHDGDIVELKI